MKAIGLISGTSVDGIDAVVVQIEEGHADVPVQIDVLGFATYPYPDGVRERILSASVPGLADVAEICHLHAYVGELFAQAAMQIAAATGTPLAEIAVIGSHGQTIQHLPTPKDEGGVWVTSTLQIGESAIIAERTGVTTVADFRPRDMAAGGQGAPLAPYAHYMLFRHPSRTRIITNIGGISNVTYLAPGASPEQVIAFDTGPGNMLIDYLMTQFTHGLQTYDQDGSWAARGACQPDFLAWLLAHPYFQRKPPKSTGREEFGPTFAEWIRKEAQNRHLTPEDELATVTEFTAASIVNSYHDFLPCFQAAASETASTQIDVIFCGGGVKNRTLMQKLCERLTPLPVTALEDVAFSSDAFEAVTFALLARETLLGRPANLPSVTGARGAVVLGKIVPGKNFQGMLERERKGTR